MSQFTIFCALSCHNFIWVSLKEDSAAPRVAGAIKIVSLRETELQKILDDAYKAKKGGKEKFMSIPNFKHENLILVLINVCLCFMHFFLYVMVVQTLLMFYALFLRLYSIFIFNFM